MNLHLVMIYLQRWFSLLKYGFTYLVFSLEARGDVACLVCKYTVSSNLYDEKVIQYTVKFNAVQVPKVNIRGLY